MSRHDRYNHPRIIWYGPYPCPACLGLIIKASRHQGGIELDSPLLVYPNTVWTEHVCPTDTKECDVPPEGWFCTRERGHDGPCAALPTREHVLS